MEDRKKQNNDNIETTMLNPAIYGVCLYYIYYLNIVTLKALNKVYKSNAKEILKIECFDYVKPDFKELVNKISVNVYKYKDNIKFDFKILNETFNKNIQRQIDRVIKNNESFSSFIFKNTTEYLKEVFEIELNCPIFISEVNGVSNYLIRMAKEANTFMHSDTKIPGYLTYIYKMQKAEEVDYKISITNKDFKSDFHSSSPALRLGNIIDDFAIQYSRQLLKANEVIGNYINKPINKYLFLNKIMKANTNLYAFANSASEMLALLTSVYYLIAIGEKDDINIESEINNEIDNHFHYLKQYQECLKRSVK